MKKTKRISRYISARLIFGVLVCLTVAPKDALAEDPNDLLVVVNKANPIKSITVQELKMIYSRERNLWQNNTRIVPINAPANTPERIRFAEAVFKMSSTEESRYWQEQKVMHGIQPPLVLDNRKRKRLRAIFQLRGAITYIMRKDVTINVYRTLLVIPASPH